MFIGLVADREGIGTIEMWQACADFASDFEKRFGSLRCKELRPEGFNDDDPPHVCEVLTVESIVFSARFVADWFGIEMKLPESKPADHRSIRSDASATRPDGEVRYYSRGC
jgi:hypothetical protein